MAAGYGWNRQRVYSGRDVSVVWEIDGTATSRRYAYGWRTGDIDGDDFPDIMVNGGVEVELWSGAPTGVTAIGAGCPDVSGTIPRIGMTHVPELGADVSINLSRCQPGALAHLVLGTRNTTWGPITLPFDLTPFGFVGCDLLTSLEHAVAVTTTTGAVPHARVPLRIPNDPGIRGMTLYAQWLILGHAPTGSLGHATRALAITVQ
jgi:hypothetical protein